MNNKESIMEPPPESILDTVKAIWPALGAILAGIVAVAIKFKPIVAWLPKIWELGQTIVMGPKKIGESVDLLLKKFDEQEAKILSNQENVLKRLGEQDAKIVENLAIVIKRLDEQDVKLLAMSKELTSNGGSSIKDHIKETYNLAILNQAVNKANFYNNPIPSFECEPLQGLCVSTNAALSEQWGMSHEEMIGKNWLSAIVGDAKDKNQIWENYQESLKLGVPYSAEYHIYNKHSKERITVLVSVTPLKDSKGKILLYQGVSNLLPSAT